MGTLTDKQKEACAVITMRDAIISLAEREQIPYEQAMLRFTGSKIYDALFDFETGIWKESPVYLLDLYLTYCAKPLTDK